MDLQGDIAMKNRDKSYSERINIQFIEWLKEGYNYIYQKPTDTSSFYSGCISSLMPYVPFHKKTNSNGYKLVCDLKEIRKNLESKGIDYKSMKYEELLEEL